MNAPSLLRRPELFALLLLALHFAFALSGKREWSATSDEIAYVTAGHAYWGMNDYRLQPENGNLPQRWEGLPAWLGGAKLPPGSNPYWSTSDVWALGHAYLYELGNDAGRILFRARAMNLCWSVACGWLVFAWSRRLFGDAGGLLSLAFYCFDPTFLAHGALATSDVCMTFFMLAAVGAWWRHLRDLSPRSGALSAVVFGLACVAKFSAVLLLPMFAIIAIVFRLTGGKLPARRLLWSIVGHAGMAVLVIWASFGFRYAAAAPDAPARLQFINQWEPILAAVGWQGRVIGWLRDWHALPEAFLFGYNHVLAFAQQRAAFLDGEYGVTGWVRFFPLAFLYKSTLTLLLALVVAAAVTIHRWTRTAARWPADLRRVTPLLVLFVVYWAFSLTTHLNIGHRHILPIYPVLYIFVGAIGWRAVHAWRAAGVITLAFGAAAAVEAFLIHPHELAYFNALAGGPKNGWRRLVDSSLDWGQDLPGLKRWLEANAFGEPVYLSYFGAGDPDYYGLRITRLPFLNGFHQHHPVYQPKAGVYCISATMLQATYSTIRGDWKPENEREYQTLRSYEAAMAEHDTEVKRYDIFDPIPTGDMTWDRVWRRYDELRFTRLCYYLRVRHPDANIGHSIFIFRLSQAEIDAAVNGSLRDWTGAIEAAVRNK